ncbi:hypothetical protein D3C86_1727160 [compost metagenome]
MTLAGAGLQLLEALADEPALLVQQRGQRRGVVQIVQAVVGIDVAAHLQQAGGQLGQRLGAHFVGEQGDRDQLAGDGGDAQQRQRLGGQGHETPAAEAGVRDGRVVHGSAPDCCRRICKVGSDRAGAHCFVVREPVATP